MNNILVGFFRWNFWVVITTVVVTLLSASLTWAYTLENVAGSYRATAKLKTDMGEIFIIDEVTLSKEGQASITKVSRIGEEGIDIARLDDCGGEATIVDNIVTLDFKCEGETNDVSFQQTIDLTRVEDLTSFKAPVFSSLFGDKPGETREMSFEKLAEKTSQ